MVPVNHHVIGSISDLVNPCRFPKPNRIGRNNVTAASAGHSRPGPHVPAQGQGIAGRSCVRARGVFYEVLINDDAEAV